jgi:hypothetical protein
MYAEKRNSDRKALIATGNLKQGAKAAADIETINVARDGMAISAHQKIIEGEPCEVKFEMTVDGATHRLSLRATAMFCVYAGQGAYKAGLKFIDGISQVPPLRCSAPPWRARTTCRLFPE